MAQGLAARKTPRSTRGGAVAPAKRFAQSAPGPPAPRGGDRLYGTTTVRDRPYGTTVTGQRPAFTRRTATEPTMRCPACSDAPTTTASAFSSSAAVTRPL